MNKKQNFGPNDPVRKAQAGDEHAVSELLEQYRPMLTRAVTASYPGLRDAGYTEEDLMQEASIALSDALRGYDPGRGVTFGAYAKTCVRNRLISVARKAARKRVASTAAEQPTVDGRFWDAECLLRLEGELTVYERQVLHLMVSGYKPAEIAAALSREVKSVYNAICRVKAKAAALKNES